MIQKKFRILIAAFVLLGLSGGYLWLTTKEDKPEAPVTVAEENKELTYVYQNKKEDLKKIIINPSAGTSTELYQDNGEWKVDISYSEDELKKGLINSAGATGLQMIADRVISENPADLSQYGLNPPQIEVDFIRNDGSKSSLYIGNRNPEGNKFYVKMSTEPTVYTVLSYGPKNFNFSYEDLRNKQIQTNINPEEIQHIKIVFGSELIEIVPVEENDPDIFGVKLSPFKIISPFRPNSADAENVDTLKAAVPKVITVEKYVEDNPADLSRYGLNPAVREFETTDNHHTFSLKAGNKTEDGNYFVQINNEKRVIALSPYIVDPLFQFSSFDLLAKFIILINIKNADRVHLTIDGRKYECEITRIMEEGKEEPTEHYFIDGIEIAEKPFKQLYQAIIGPNADTVNNEPTKLKNPEVIIEFELNSGQIRNPGVQYVQVDRDFYAAFIDGKNEFLVSAYQIQLIKDKLREALDSVK